MKNKHLFILAFLYLCSISSIIAQTTITIQPDSTTGKDAFIDSRQPEKNYGKHIDYAAAAWTNSGQTTIVRSLIDFDLSAIPENAIINSAYLSLYSYNSPANQAHSTASGSNETIIQRITSSWSEDQVNWSNQPSTSTTDQVTLPASVNNIQDYLNIDVTKLVADMTKTKDSSFGFLIKLATEEYYRKMIFASSDNSNKDLHPKLVITYTETQISENCITIKPNALQGKDAFIESRVPDKNYGDHIDYASAAWTNSGAQTNVRSLIDFDLSSIPNNAEINSAFLYLTSYNSPANKAHATTSGSNKSFIQRITSPWEEATVTWNNQPSTTIENQATLDSSTSSIQNYTVNVSALINDMLNDPENSYGFLIKLETEEYYRKMIFASSDNPDTTLHPKLVICYSQKSIDNILDKTIESSVNIYPNPSNGILNISLLNNINPTEINIYSSNGDLIKTITTSNNFVSFQTNDMPSGIYYARITSKNNYCNKKFIVR